MNRQKINGLAGILAGILGVTSIAQPPAVSILPKDQKLFPGSNSSYDIRINTGDEGLQPVAGVTIYGDGLPYAVQRTGSDDFSQNNIFMSGFFEGKNRDPAFTYTDPNDLTAAIVMDVFQPPYITNKNDKVVRYMFDVPSNTSPGSYNISLNRVTLSVNTGFDEGIPVFESQDVDAQNITSGSFEVVPYSWADRNTDGKVNAPDMDAFKGCATRDQVPNTQPACNVFDKDGDSDIDMNDFAKMQRCYSGQENQYDANCGQ